MLLVVVDL